MLEGMARLKENTEATLIDKATELTGRLKLEIAESKSKVAWK